MENRSLSDYVEMREGVYFVRSTRMSLDSVVYEFRRGESAEAILDHYPILKSLEKVYGVITFYLANKQEIDEYVKEHEKRCDEIRAEHMAKHPLPQALREKLERARHELAERRQ